VAYRRAKTDIHEIWMAESRAAATKAFNAFLEKDRAKYPTACECLEKDRDVLLSFYDFPAKHWVHLRTTNPINRRSPLFAYAIAAPRVVAPDALA
jgi:putative transposase